MKLSALNRLLLPRLETLVCRLRLAKCQKSKVALRKAVSIGTNEPLPTAHLKIPLFQWPKRLKIGLHCLFSDGRINQVNVELARGRGFF